MLRNYKKKIIDNNNWPNIQSHNCRKIFLLFILSGHIQPWKGNFPINDMQPICEDLYWTYVNVKLKFGWNFDLKEISKELANVLTRGKGSTLIHTNWINRLSNKLNMPSVDINDENSWITYYLKRELWLLTGARAGIIKRGPCTCRAKTLVF